MKANLSTDHPDYPDLSASYVFGFYSDFKEEVGTIKNLGSDDGHIVVLSLNGCLELAEYGIEFEWSVPKNIFEKDKIFVSERFGKFQTLKQYIFIPLTMVFLLCQVFEF